MNTYEFKLYNNKRNRHLDKAMLLAAEIYNHCIALHRRYYRLTGKHISLHRLQKHITKLKHTERYKHWNELGSQAVQDIAERIDGSYQAMFVHIKEGQQGKKRPPKFRKPSKYRSFTLKQCGYKFSDDNRVTIMGRRYKYTKHREIEGKIKTVTIKRNTLGEYFLYVTCEVELPQIKARLGNAIGFDFGLKHFLTGSDGTVIDAPEYYRATLKDLRNAHRSLSRKTGKTNRTRALRALERIYIKVSNARRDWFFKLSKHLATSYSCICIEDLNIEAMKKLWGRKISDYAFSEFVMCLEWACQKYGCKLIKVDRWQPTTKPCHVCGYINNGLTLKDRVWTCPNCNAVHDRDVNAAINILNLGLASA
ncbi:MAG: transposase [Clostridia bacterium]|nr:transposase [Clostridia bacterium]